MVCAFGHVLRIVSWYQRARIPRCHRSSSLFNLHQAETLALVGRIADSEQYRKTERAQRAPFFYPLCRIETIDWRHIIARTD
jgi:hypothetical protein